MAMAAATAQATALLQGIRLALQRQQVESACRDFLKLPDLNTSAYPHLEAILRDGYTAGRYDIQVVLSFLEELPDWHWTLDGCCVLYRVMEVLQTSALHAVHMPMMPLAFFLHKLMNHLDGSAKVRAEAYWYEWLSPTIRAVVLGKPLIIEALKYRERMYAPLDSMAYDPSRRQVFTWGDAWTDDDCTQSYWRLVPTSTLQKDRFFIQSVQFNEYVYAADYAKVPRDTQGSVRSRVFTWRRDDDVGDMGHWQLIALSQDDRSLFALYNPYQKEFLFASPTKFDRLRRHVYTTAHRPQSVAWLEERKFRITPAVTSAEDDGIEAFFLRRYADAVELLTKALEHEELSSDLIRCRTYRMAAYLRMGQLDLMKQDFDQIEAVGGDKAAIFHGLQHLWTESEQALHPTDAVMAIPQHMLEGSRLFVAHEYDAALESFQLVTAPSCTTQDTALRLKQAEAQLAIAKCLFALEQWDASWEALEQSLARIASLTPPPVAMEARARLWMGKCRRRQQRYAEAIACLEQALDRWSLQHDSAVVDASSTWLQCAVDFELKLIGILQRDLLSPLLSTQSANSTGTETGTSTNTNGSTREADGAVIDTKTSDKLAQRLIDLFQCPLTLELMEDPVITPNGDTYERSMIEHHLDVNGQFDPMTRTPLTREQLIPNRALKTLMEMLLSEHRLGIMLAACTI